MSSFYVNCYKCNIVFDELDIPIKCDSCNLLIHGRCSGLTSREIRCFSLKNRSLKYFCQACNNGLRDLPELKQSINRVLAVVSELKNGKNYNIVPRRSEELIINERDERNNIRAQNLIFKNVPQSSIAVKVSELQNGKNYNIVKRRSEELIINERDERNNIRAHNLIFKNVPQSSITLHSTERIAHNTNPVSNIVDSIKNNANTSIKPLKIIRLINCSQNNPRPIQNIVKYTFPTFHGKGIQLMKTNYSRPGERLAFCQDFLNRVFKSISSRANEETVETFHYPSLINDRPSTDIMNQFPSPPVYSGKGMILMMKMGWKPGNKLGKPQSEKLKPLLLNISTKLKARMDSQEKIPKFNKDNGQIPSSSKADKNIRQPNCSTVVNSDERLDKSQSGSLEPIPAYIQPTSNLAYIEPISNLTYIEPTSDMDLDKKDNSQIPSSSKADEKLRQPKCSTVGNCDERLDKSQSGSLEPIPAYIQPTSNLTNIEPISNLTYIEPISEVEMVKKDNSQIPSSSKADEQLRKLKCSTAVDCNKGMQLMLKMGWSSGERLGKNQYGSLEPLPGSLVKPDIKGLISVDKKREIIKGLVRAEPKTNIHHLSKKPETKDNSQIPLSSKADEKLRQPKCSTVGNCDERLDKSQSGSLKHIQAYIQPTSNLTNIEPISNLTYIEPISEVELDKKDNSQIPSSSKADEKLRKLKCSTAVDSNKGMRLMLKMGWSPGERLGKNQHGLLKPIPELLVKMDKKGLLCADEKREKIKESVFTKAKFHKPIEALVLFCGKSRWNHPKFVELDRNGPPNKESFVMAVVVNKVWYCSWRFQTTITLAKEDAAKQCLVELGIPLFKNY